MLSDGQTVSVKVLSIAPDGKIALSAFAGKVPVVPFSAVTGQGILYA